MSTSVDDLVISLTIDPGSDLGKLKKQLDALVGTGKEGEKAEVRGAIKEIATRIRNIEWNVGKLTPLGIPGRRDIHGIRSQAASHWRRLVDFDKEALIDVLMRSPQLPMQEFGAETPGELRKVFSNWIEWVMRELQKVFMDKSDLATDSMQRLLEVVKKIGMHEFSDLERGMQIFRDMQKIMPEKVMQQRIEKFFRRFGEIDPQLPLFPIKEEFWRHKGVREYLEKEGIDIEGEARFSTITKEQKDKFEKDLRTILKGVSLTDHPFRVDITMDLMDKIYEELSKEFPDLAKQLRKALGEEGGTLFIELKRNVTKEIIDVIKAIREKQVGQQVLVWGLQASKKVHEHAKKEGVMLSILDPLILEPKRAEFTAEEKETMRDLTRLISESEKIEEKVTKIKEAAETIRATSATDAGINELKDRLEELMERQKEIQDEMQEIKENTETFL